MILVRLISWPYVRRHLLRAALTTMGIVLGVTVFVGMHTANQTVLQGLRRTVDRVAGKAQMQVSAGDGGFPEEVLERVQAVPEVRVAVPVIEAAVQTNIPGQGNLLILAVDMTGDRSLRDYDLDSGDEAVIDDPLVFLAQPDSLMVSRDFADRNGLVSGNKITLGTMVGDRTFTVRGLMRTSGLTSAFGGNLAIMDIYAAQVVFGRGRTFDRIDVALNDGVAAAEGRRAIQSALGPGFQVEAPSSRGEQFESVLTVYTVAMNINSLFALFIGMFIIYNSFAIAVTQRRSEIGILRALGATRGQIRTLFLFESALAGLVGACFGCVGGLLAARGIAGPISGMIEGIYGFTQRPGDVEVRGELLAFALAIGVLTSILAALIPARQAARVDPVQALQKGKYQVLSAGENRTRRRLAVVFAVAAVTCLFFGSSTFVFYAGFLLAVFSVLLLTPTLALWLVRALRPLLAWLRPVEGTLAADSLIQSPRRTSGTVAALMLSLMLVIGLGGLARGSYTSILDWVETVLNPDLFVSTSENLTTRAFRFPATMGPELASIEGVEAIHQVRSIRIPYGGSPVTLLSVEMAGLAERAPRRAVAGDVEEMYRLTARGQGAMVSENLANLRNIVLGQILDIPTPSGSLRLPVVGIVEDWSDNLGTILIDRQVFVRAWQDDSVSIFRVYVEKGVEVEAVRRRILDKFSATRRLFVLTNREVRGYITGLTDQWMGLTYTQIAVAVLVAVLGIVNSLTVSIMDRRRELGVLRAVGGLRDQIRRTVWMEAVAISLIGVILGLAMGALDLYYILEMTRRDIGGMNLDYLYPVKIALGLLPTMLAAALLSALGPAETAVRGSLVEALEYE